MTLQKKKMNILLKTGIRYGMGSGNASKSMTIDYPAAKLHN